MTNTNGRFGPYGGQYVPEALMEALEKLEVYYLANKSDNLYFTLLGDCSQSGAQNEKFDEEVIRRGDKASRKVK